MTNILERFQKLLDDTGLLKEDIVQLQGNLNVAAKIEVQTYEKVNESRISRLEKMVEDMKLKENNLLHIIEETNSLKDQIDSLREMSFHASSSSATGPSDVSFGFNEATIEQELQRQPQIILPSLTDQYQERTPALNSPPVSGDQEELVSEHEFDSQSQQMAPPTKIVGNICLGEVPAAESLHSLDKNNIVANNCLSSVLSLWLCFFD